MQEELKARLHPHWVGGEAGYVYSVICEGKLLVERSRDPECDAARALVAEDHWQAHLMRWQDGEATHHYRH
jgi:hypothetical protein